MEKFIQHTELKVQVIMLFALLFIGFSIKAQYNYIGTYDSNGKPFYLEPIGDQVSQAFLDDIDASLPEGKPVPTYNPQYISTGTETDVCLRDSATVWVTYVAEGAGYRNTLGYYTYDVLNPPKSINDITYETIIFPNVSNRNSGGDLIPGDKVKLGDFPAGTGIGWFLIANGWNGSQVGNGNWKVYSNPDFNPESNPSDRNHIVLLNDSINKRVVLGFEDIRRDYASCDQDFNDAIFFVSANPYTAIITDSINTISDSDDGVSSGGNGGLESNGNLAARISLRNFRREKNRIDYNDFESLLKFNSQNIKAGYTRSKSRNKSVDEKLHELLPSSSMFNTIALETTPDDLLDITNAKEIFAVDYVHSNLRKASALVMYSEGQVYEHTKVVCDRLKGAEIVSIRKVSINQHEFILTQLRQANGDFEYAVNFVVQEQVNGQYIVDNHWTLNEYNLNQKNINFQIWSSTVSMTIQLVQDALLNVSKRGTIVFANNQVQIPSLYVKSGKYEQTILKLEIVNPNRVSQIELLGNYTRTETSDRESFLKNIPLSGSVTEQVIIPVGSIYDIGFEIKPVNPGEASQSIVPDVIYSADGAWGVDFEEHGAELNAYTIFTTPESSPNQSYSLERGVEANGKVLNYIGFFKQLNLSGLGMDLSEFNALQFKIQGDAEVEVCVLKASITNWSNQYKFRFHISGEEELKTIFFSELKSNSDLSFNPNDITSISVSIIGDGQQEQAFDIKMSEFKFTQAIEPVKPLKNINIFPNPVNDYTKVYLHSESNEITRLEFYSIQGQFILDRKVSLLKGENYMTISCEKWKPGIYLLRAIVNGEERKSKFVVQ